MSYGLCEQKESFLSYAISPKRAKRKSYKEIKKMKHKAERARCRMDIICIPCYNKYRGWEY